MSRCRLVACRKPSSGKRVFFQVKSGKDMLFYVILNFVIFSKFLEQWHKTMFILDNEMCCWSLPLPIKSNFELLKTVLSQTKGRLWLLNNSVFGYWTIPSLVIEQCRLCACYLSSESSRTRPSPWLDWGQLWRNQNIRTHISIPYQFVQQQQKILQTTNDSTVQ